MIAAVYARKSTLAWLLSALALTGCGRYYYGKPGTFPAIPMDFRINSTACIRDVGVPSGNGQCALVAKEPYRRCMLARGWTREEKIEPGNGWLSASRQFACRRTYLQDLDWRSNMHKSRSA